MPNYRLAEGPQRRLRRIQNYIKMLLETVPPEVSMSEEDIITAVQRNFPQMQPAIIIEALTNLRTRGVIDED